MRHLLSFMQHEVVLALGWTLIHSLWQGLLLALVTGIMLLATRKSEAQKRYELLTGLFLLFIAVTGMTFARELYLAYAHPHFRPLANIAAGRSVISSIIPFAESHIVVNRSWASRLKEYFNEHAYLIVTIWFIIFVARFIKLIGEVAYIQRLKTYRTSEPPQAWKNRLKELMNKMSINTYVQLLESGIVKVPVVMGILKPVILLPLGLLSQLPPDEIEAILLHELAHIRRRDYFVNLVQSFAETLFFFNPALMWLSSLIRDERENCCDDIAISVTNNKTTFIDALISFQEFDLGKPSFTMGFPGRKHQLLNRVKRIISKRNKTLNTTEKSILTLSMAILIMFSFVAAKNIPVSKIRKKLSFYNAPAATPSFNKPNEKLPEALAIREKAETVSSFSLTGYTPVLHEMIDTTPVIPAKPAQQPLSMSYTFPQKGDSAIDFQHYSTDVSVDGNTKTISIGATHRNGTTYKLKMINDNVIEFSINGKEIPETEFKNYLDIIEVVQRPYQSKKAKSESDKLRAQLQHESDLNKQAIAEINKHLEKIKSGETPRTIRRVLSNDRWVNPDSLTKVEFLNKQQELDTKLLELNKLKGNDDVEAKKQRLKALNVEMKHLDFSISELDAIVKASLQKTGNWQKLNQDMVKLKETPYKAEKFNTSSSNEYVKNKIDLKRKTETESLRKKTEELRRELQKTEEKLSRIQKNESIKKQQQKDVINFDQQSVDIKRMIAALPDHFYIGAPTLDFNQLFNNGVELMEQSGVDVQRSKGASYVTFRSSGEYTLKFIDKRTDFDNAVFEKKVLVNMLPKPIVRLSGANYTDMANVKELLSGQMVTYVILPGAGMSLPGKVNSFRTTKISQNSKQESAQNYSGMLQSATWELINKSQKGDVIMFDNILVSLSDGTTRNAGPLTYKITDP